jgi:VPDSG-CTERM motif
MKTLTKTILAVLATGLISCALFSQQAQADPMITGTITFGGSVNLDTASAGTATMVTGWHGFGGVGNPLVVDADGDFLANGVMPGVSTGTFATPWSFNSGPVANFWQVGIFTFNLTASSIFMQGGNPAGVVVTGYGWITAPGFAPTYGTWAFSTQDPSAGQPARFSFSAATGSVPDSGSTVAFLGLALVGVEALRRRIRTAK